MTALLTNEPGGSPLGARLRQLLLHDEVPMSSLAEAFLFCADRAEHVESIIVPALEQGHWAICDRFSASTFAYQVCAGQMERELFHQLDGLACSGLARVAGRGADNPYPDLTIILDLDPAQGLWRELRQPCLFAEDNFEARPLEYHQRVRQGFLEYAEMLGAAAIVLDGDRPVDEVHRDILAAVGLSD